MATQKLDEKTAIDLQEGEVVIFSNTPKLHHVLGWFRGYQCNFVITNKRIALVPYKTDKETTTINYKDIESTFPVFPTIQKNPDWGNKSGTAGQKIDFQIKMKKNGSDFSGKKLKFEIRASVKTMFKNMGKELGSELKTGFANMMQMMDYQAKAQNIDNTGLSADQKNAAKTAAWWTTTNEWKKYEGGKVTITGEHFIARNVIIELVDAAVKAYT
jgi:hypothetical protein